MKVLLCLLAVAFDAVAFFVVGGSYANSQWPQPHSITPFWVPQLIASGAAVIFSSVYLWRHLRARSSRLSHLLPVFTAGFAVLCLCFALYYPFHLQHEAAEYGARIRAGLDSRNTQHQEP